MSHPSPRFAPPAVLAAALFTLKRACVHARNLTLAANTDVRQVNSLMEAVHEVPHFLTDWSDQRLAELRLHFSCFDHEQWPGSPDLLATFNECLDDHNSNA